jgi:O-antigen ligase
MNRLLINTHKLQLWLWFAILFLLPLSVRLSSIAISFSVLVFIVLSFFKPISFPKKNLLYFLPPLLYFLVQLLPIGNRIFEISSLKEIEQNLPLLAIPLLIILSGISKNEFSATITKALFYSVMVGSLMMLFQSLMDYGTTSDINEFTYHNLAEPLGAGAIYFSFYIVIVLLRINDLAFLFVKKWIGILSVGFLTIILFLLASKILLAFGMLFFILKQRKWIIKNLPYAKIVAPALFLLIAVLMVPVGQRFSKIFNPRLDIVMNESYTYDSPLNGLNLRLIQARLGFEILNEKGAWLVGVGADQSQDLLDRKYIEKGIYTGYENTNDRGYLGYNFHNQYIETLVRSGITGIIALLLMIFVVLRTPSENLFASGWEMGLILLFFVTESVLERQIGIVFFSVLYAAYFPNLKMNDIK